MQETFTRHAGAVAAESVDFDFASTFKDRQLTLPVFSTTAGSLTTHTIEYRIRRKDASDDSDAPWLTVVRPDRHFLGGYSPSCF